MDDIVSTIFVSKLPKCRPENVQIQKEKKRKEGKYEYYQKRRTRKIFKLFFKQSNGFGESLFRE